MKKFVWVCEAAAFLVLLSFLSFPVHADPSIIVADYQLHPEELMPGDTGILTLVVTNAEAIATTTKTTTDAIQSVSITKTNGVVIERIWISPAADTQGRQIRSLLGINGYKDLGNLAAGASLSLSFELIAEENISDGYYFPKVHIDLQNDDNGIYEDVVFPIELRINADSLNMVPRSIPSTMSMSGATDISFTLVNLRESSLTNIMITPQDEEELTILPEKLIINQLLAKETQEIHFSLIPAQVGAQEIIFDIQYKNGQNSHTQSTRITIETVENYDVAPIIYALPATMEQGTTETIRLKVYNAKTEGITSVIITPTTAARITPSQYFIGSMDADDIYSLSFDIDTTGLSINQTYDIGFTVSFKQDDITYTTPVIQSSFSIIPAKTNGDEVALLLSVVIIILLIVVYFVYRWRKKQRMKKLSVTQA